MTCMNEITDHTIKRLVAKHGTPLYIYSTKHLRDRARQIGQVSAPFGLTVRYAVKANPHPGIIELFAKEGLHFDASSSYETDLLLDQGIDGSLISLSSQQPPHDFPTMINAGVHFVATSMHQLQLFARFAPAQSAVGLRINTGFGSGHNNRTTTSGVNASFGLWHEYIERAVACAAENDIRITRLHVHIGSGADPEAWRRTIDGSLSFVERLPDVTSLDIGGGFKIERYEGEPETDIAKVMTVFGASLRAFQKKTGRAIHLEIEPGTWLVGHAGTLVTEIIDSVDTGSDGFTFLRTNTGMNDFMRPTLYGAQHRMRVLNDASTQSDYVVVGHNCESGDILTPEPGNPENIRTRSLSTASIGDIITIADVGAYGASLRAQNYNAFPSAREILV